MAQQPVEMIRVRQLATYLFVPLLDPAMDFPVTPATEGRTLALHERAIVAS